MLSPRVFLLKVTVHGSRQRGTMVTYGGMSKKPVTVSTSAFIFKVLKLLKKYFMNKNKMMSQRLYVYFDFTKKIGQVHEQVFCLCDVQSPKDKRWE